MIAEWIDHELRNWSRWAWSGEWPHPLPQTHAASAEGRYLPPSDLGDPAPPKAPKPLHERAQLVQTVYDQRMSQRERFVIAAEYPRKYVSGRHLYGRAGAARRLRISLAMYEAALRTGARLVGEAFEGR